jgi:hypothetical protein
MMGDRGDTSQSDAVTNKRIELGQPGGIGANKLRVWVIRNKLVDDD